MSPAKQPHTITPPPPQRHSEWNQRSQIWTHQTKAQISTGLVTLETRVGPKSGLEARAGCKVLYWNRWTLRWGSELEAAREWRGGYLLQGDTHTHTLQPYDHDRSSWPQQISSACCFYLVVFFSGYLTIKAWFVQRPLNSWCRDVSAIRTLWHSSGL